MNTKTMKTNITKRFTEGVRLNTGLEKVAVQYSADTFVVNQSLVLRINICGENRHLRQARKRCRRFSINISSLFSFGKAIKTDFSVLLNTIEQE